jgi:hypothetical protein
MLSFAGLEKSIEGRLEPSVCADIGFATASNPVDDNDAKVQPPNHSPIILLGELLNLELISMNEMREQMVIGNEKMILGDRTFRPAL